jgi:hypothetical protein
MEATNVTVITEYTEGWIDALDSYSLGFRSSALLLVYAVLPENLVLASGSSRLRI